MKKYIIRNVLAAFIILLASSFLTVQGQGEVKVEFLNTLEASFGNPDGIGGRNPDAGIDPKITLEFKVDPVGNIELVSKTISTIEGNINVVEGWSKTNIGKTAYSGIFGGSFRLILSSNKRLQTGWRAPWHGIGCQGTNQWRIDGGKNNPPEEVYFTLEGDVGLEFTSIDYIDINYQDGQAHFMIQDFDTKETHFFENIALPDVGSIDVTGKYSMRYKTDRITISGDPAVGNNNAGGKLYGFEFNVVAPLPKPPAIFSVKPIRNDSLSFAVSDDIEIQFDNEMDQAKTSAAVTISPAISNRVDKWSAEDEGDLLTISHDDLELETWYTLVVSDAAEATNGLTMLVPDTIRFKTLPPKPTVVSTYPEFNATDVLPNTTMYIEFSKPMNTDSVEKGIVFDPEVSGAEFVWSDDRTTVFISANELFVSTMYFLTVGPPAMDDFFQQLADSYVGIFTTAITTSVDNLKSADLVLYPNPASDVLRAEGVDVASL
ncbi:MAG: Ig-like domain-containing protein, partial [Eudoraea sp.]|nr:Ig-like domain-containing protein [Eudoraea sp.]